MIKVSTQDLKEVLHLTPSAQNIMIVGSHGIGKSQILKQYYEKEKKYLSSHFFLDK